MPRIFKNELDANVQNFLKLVGKNASAVDRTGTFVLPFDTEVLSPIPTSLHIPDPQSAFNQALLNRAMSILDEGKEVVLYYSGGLDSTTTLVAFNKVINDNIKYTKDQVTIATSLDAMYENKKAWWDIVLNYRVTNVHKAMSLMRVGDGKRHVFSENADQLFGSDKMFRHPNLTNMLLNDRITEQNLSSYLDESDIVTVREDFMHKLSHLIKAAPFELTHMRELLWWVNFTCKWQSVSLRALCFTDVFTDSSISATDLRSFDTFYNDVELQKVSMTKDFSRFGDEPSPETYKNAFRKFLSVEHPSWQEYITHKVKVGSLYHVIKHRSFAFDMIYFDTDTKTFTVSN